jgi:predicted DNA-binding ribbon-helix-helix protein
MTARSKTPKRRTVRQSVTIPMPLANHVRRVAKERHLTISRALVALAERGVQAEAEAQRNLRSAYRGYLAENEPAKKSEIGKTLVRSIFGKDAIAEDSVR